MTYKEMQELIKLVSRLELSEFKMKDKDFKLTIRTKEYSKNNVLTSLPTAPTISSVLPSVVAPTPPISPAPTEASKETKDNQEKSAPTETKKEYLEIKSPIVGTFYRSAGPEKPAYMKVGDKVSKGSVVCIVEAMKLFNEIESEVSGTIVKVMVEDAQPVEYDQVLFLVEP